jgi:hypothetical protein
MDEDEVANSDDASSSANKQEKRQWRKQLDEVYLSIFHNAMKVLEKLKFRCQPLFVEQPMCLIHRHETNKVRDDLVLCDADPEDFGLLQLFFNLVGTSGEAKVCYYSFEQNEWIDFFEAMGMRPTHSWPNRPMMDSPLGIKRETLPSRPHWRDLLS